MLFFALLLFSSFLGNTCDGCFDLPQTGPSYMSFRSEIREKRIRDAMKHPDKLGAGARKRRQLDPKDRTEAVMREFHRGTLNFSGGKVKNPKQAIAIALSESRRK